jgi:hypothetical protein
MLNNKYYHNEPMLTRHINELVILIMNSI